MGSDAYRSVHTALSTRLAFHTLKADAIHGHVFDNDHALRMAISHDTRRYNRTRMHSSLDYRSPIDYERLAA